MSRNDTDRLASASLQRHYVFHSEWCASGCALTTDTGLEIALVPLILAGKLKAPPSAYYRRHYHHWTPCSIMSQTPSQANSPSNYRTIFDSALEAYKRRTGKDLTSDPLLRRIETCHSPDDILVILREHISGSDLPLNNNDGLTKCLNPTVNVLYTFSTIIGTSPGLVSLWNLGFAAV